MVGADYVNLLRPPFLLNTSSWTLWHRTDFSIISVALGSITLHSLTKVDYEFCTSVISTKHRFEIRPRVFISGSLLTQSASYHLLSRYESFNKFQQTFKPNYISFTTDIFLQHLHTIVGFILHHANRLSGYLWKIGQAFSKENCAEICYGI